MKTAFPAVVSSDCKLVILGSMPGERSLQAAEYYAHPQNAFWWIMSQLTSVPIDTPYQQRLARLKQAGIGLWDVLHRCEREGSLDSNIQQDSAEANDFEAFLKQYPSIKAIFFNGRTVENLFKRHVIRGNQFKPSIPCLALPSTSPANARLRKEQKLLQWQQIMNYL